MPNVTVYVHIINALNLLKDNDKECLPVAEVECLGEKKETKKPTDPDLNPFWDVQFTFRKLAPDLKSETCYLRIFDANTWFKNELIGEFEFNLADVHSQKTTDKDGNEVDTHEYYKEWCPLMKPAEEGQEDDDDMDVKGWLKCSILVLDNDASDQFPSHEEDDPFSDPATDDAEDLASAVLTVPKMKMNGYLLRVFVWRAYGLPKMDWFGGVDAYVGVKFNGNLRKTEFKVSTLKPVWEQELGIPVRMPTVSDTIELKLYDHDDLGEDDLISTFHFSFKDEVLEEGYMPARWIHIYGHPPDHDVRDVMQRCYKLMIDEPERTQYKGRILVSMIAEKVDNVKTAAAKYKGKVMGIRRGDLIPEVTDSAVMATTEYYLWVDLWQGASMDFSISLQSVYVEVWWGDKIVRSSNLKKDPHSGALEWMEQLPEIVQKHPIDLKQVPIVVINLFTEIALIKTRIAYTVFYPTGKKYDEEGYLPRIQDGQKPVWYTLTPDIFSNKKGAGAPVSLQFRVGMSPTSELTADRGHIEKPPLKRYQMRANVFQARGLRAANAEGTSDPYVLVRCGSFSAKTRFVEGTCCPMWYETISFHCNLPPEEGALEAAPRIEVLIYDEDEVDQLIGQYNTVINDQMFVWPFEKFSPTLPKKWERVEHYYGMARAAAGEILITFDILHPNLASEPGHVIQPLYDAIEWDEEKWLEARILGLRDLQPPSSTFFSKNQLTNPKIKISCGIDASIIEDLRRQKHHKVEKEKEKTKQRQMKLERQTISVTPPADTADGGFFDRFLPTFLRNNNEHNTNRTPTSTPAPDTLSEEEDSDSDSTEDKKSKLLFKSDETDGCDQPMPENPNHLQVLCFPVKLPKDPLFYPNIVIEVFQTKGRRTRKGKKKKQKITTLGVCDQKLTDILKGTALKFCSVPNSDLKEVLEKNGLDPTKGQDDDEANQMEVEAATGQQMEAPSDSDDELDENADSDSNSSSSSGSSDGPPDPGRQGIKLEHQPAEKYHEEFDFHLDKLPYWKYKVIRGMAPQPVGNGCKFDRTPRNRIAGWFKGKFKLLNKQQIVDLDMEGSSSDSSASESESSDDEPPEKPAKDDPHLWADRWIQVAVRRWQRRFKTEELVMRAYVYRGFYLVPVAQGADGQKTNAYLKLEMADDTEDGAEQVYPDQEMFSKAYPTVLNTLSPRWRHTFGDAAVTLPGASFVTIGVYDYGQKGFFSGLLSNNKVGGGADMIGETKIDLEDRWYCKKWRKHNRPSPKESPQFYKMPTEERVLESPTTVHPQGKLEMFIQMVKKERVLEYQAIDIKGPLPEDYEIATIIRRLRDTKPPPGMENQPEFPACGPAFCRDPVLDLSVSVIPKWNYPEEDVDAKREKKTDTQKKCAKGRADFNWRILTPVTLPCKFHFVSICVWDSSGWIGRRSQIAENVFNLKAFFERAHKGKFTPSLKKRDNEPEKQTAITREGKDQWIELKHPRTGDDPRAKLELSMVIYKKPEINKTLWSEGEEAWRTKQLPKPKRPPTDFAPWNVCGWARYFAWRYRWKCYVCCCSCILLLIGIVALYFFVLK